MGTSRNSGINSFQIVGGGFNGGANSGQKMGGGGGGASDIRTDCTNYGTVLVVAGGGGGGKSPGTCYSSGCFELTIFKK